MTKTRQEQAFADLAKRQKAERKAAPLSNAQMDRMLFGLGRKTGLLDGYKGPEVMGDDLRNFLNKKIG
jgi:hypothetical protein